MKPADFDSIREDLLKETSDLAALPYKSVGTEWLLRRKREQLAAWDAHVTALAERVSDAAAMALELVDAKVEIANLRGEVARLTRGDLASAVVALVEVKPVGPT